MHRKTDNRRLVRWETWIKRFGVLTILVVSLPGCILERDPARSTFLNSAGTWVPQATQLRIFPSTRFVKEGVTTLLECRIELLDEMGDPLKSSGHLVVQLNAADAERDGPPGERLTQWEIKLATQHDQNAFYDPITRGYFFRLKLLSPDATQRATQLHVRFTPPTDEPIEDAIRLEPRGSAER